jgi:pimeloyl-ACP methyl ester carboxylesterase
MFNWYRAAFHSRPGRVSSLRVKPPTLIIWGERDKFLSRELAEQSLAMCEAGKLVYIENASHWVQHEEPARVNAFLLKFFNSSKPEPKRRTENNVS